MDLLAFHATLGVIVLILVVIAVKLLSDPDWFRGFMKGVLGMGFLAAAVAGGYVIFDMMSFKVAKTDAPLITLNIQKKEEQRFDVDVKGEGIKAGLYDVLGDQAEFKIQMLYWSGPAVQAGLKTAYRVEGLEGRFLSLEQERNVDKTQHPLKSDPFIPFWKIMNQSPFLPFIRATYAEGVYIPLAEGASFSLSLEGDEIVINPDNEAAKSAMANLGS